jgi:branched-chain amino acid transport system permease protein
VFGLSGAIAGVAGGLYALKLTLVDADVPLLGLFGSVTLLVALVVGGAAQNWGPFVGAMFYVFVNDFARSVGENPSDSLLFGWLVDEGTKLDGLGGVTFGVLLILFARFVPFGAVGTMRMWRSRVVQVIPRIPVPAVEQGAKGPGTTSPPPTNVQSAETSAAGDDESAT